MAEFIIFIVSATVLCGGSLMAAKLIRFFVKYSLEHKNNDKK